MTVAFAMRFGSPTARNNCCHTTNNSANVANRRFRSATATARPFTGPADDDDDDDDEVDEADGVPEGSDFFSTDDDGEAVEVLGDDEPGDAAGGAAAGTPGGTGRVGVEPNTAEGAVEVGLTATGEPCT